MGFVKSLIWILIISLILSGCDDREEYELVLDNPFDPDNPQTSGDPFQLSVQTEGRKSILKWNVPEIDFEKYIIYRQEDDVSLIQLSVVPKTSPNMLMIPSKAGTVISTEFQLAEVSVLARKNKVPCLQLKTPPKST